ncbi:CBF-domain-containing protein [Tricholoma matsutake]|nr:CBF-domain-containing protein [Tricholoma matsutake 945]
MARLQTEKAGSSRPAFSKKSTKTKPTDTALYKQVLALGGTHDDIDLLKNVDGNAITGPSKHDPALSKDVSKFLKELNLTESEPQKSEKPRKPVNQQKKIRPQKDLSQRPIKDIHVPEKSSVSGKKQKKSASQKISDPNKSEPPIGDVPKLQPPTKVSLNPKSHFVFQPTSQWYTAIPPLAPPASSAPTISSSQLASLTSKATELHTTDMRTFQSSASSNSTSSEASFLFKIIQSGTLSDRLSALTLLVQSSPLHNTKALETLQGMAERGKGKGGREESLKALRCIVDWWVGGGAPDRKLKYFRDQPLTHPSVTDEHLLLWYFEDWLKKYFFSILQILETLSLDPLSYVRTQALTLIFTLLRDKPEQEQNLLRLLVNKLGDTDKSLCSRTSYHLLQLLQTHPSMKAVIVREIIALILRPSAPPSTSGLGLPNGTGKHIRFSNDPKPKSKPAPTAGPAKKGGNAHARYYATITFNQIVLTPEDKDVALKLIGVYFEMFKELLGEDPEEGGEDQKVEDEKGEIDVHVDKRGRVRDKGKGKGKGKAMEVKGAAGFAEVEDVHSKLISAILTGVNRALPFTKIDAGDIGLNKHIDTLFLITHTSTFNISLQALVLIQQITTSFGPSAASPSASISKTITDRYYRTLYASLHDPRLASSSKQAMYLNLFFKSVKADVGNGDGERMKAMIKRFVQLLVSGGSGATEFTAGGLYLLGELFSTTPGSRAMLNDNGKTEAETYDPRKRDPQFAHAASSPLWELIPLLHHYHPAIALHARQLLSSQPLTASADLSRNTLSHFLDRFVYKNPKKLKAGENVNESATAKAKGPSAMQPAASGLDGTTVKLMKGEVLRGDEGLMNEDEFLRKKVEDVPADQVFFHRFFTRKNEKEKAKANKAEKQKAYDEDEDDAGEGEDGAKGESVASDAETASAHESDVPDYDQSDSDSEEGEIWKVMKATMPKAAGEEDDLMEDSDDLPSDFDEDMDSDEENTSAGDEDTLALVEGSDNEDLVSLDGDIPEGLLDYEGSESSDHGEEEWGGIDTGEDKKGKKRKRDDTGREKRKKLRSLPTFASYEDYAKMIEDGPEDDL